MDSLQQKVKKYFTTYQVSDVFYSTAEILFILESPHTQEIKHGYPVAGNSGREMTRFIYDKPPEEPLGKLVSNQQEFNSTYQNLTKLGLLNVCPAPMQKQALKEYKLKSTEEKILTILEKLRVNYKADCHQKQEWNLVKKLILADFTERLNQVITDCPKLNYLVPCGKFAASYLDVIVENLDLAGIKIIDGIPHPSFNQWQKYDSMIKLEQILPAT